MQQLSQRDILVFWVSSTHFGEGEEAADLNTCLFENYSIKGRFQIKAILVLWRSGGFQGRRACTNCVVTILSSLLSFLNFLAIHHYFGCSYFSNVGLE